MPPSSSDLIKINEKLLVLVKNTKDKQVFFASSSSLIQSSTMISTWFQTIIDSSHLITFCISISVIIYGSFRSLRIDTQNDDNASKNEDETNDNSQSS
jgi:hypothetical protein